MHRCTAATTTSAAKRSCNWRSGSELTSRFADRDTHVTVGELRPSAMRRVANPAWPRGVIFTVGHSTLPIERFVALLAAYGIERLVDVRALPRSRRHPQFNGDALRESLRAAKVEYYSLRELGGMRKPRADSPNGGWREEAFRGYADYMQTTEFGQALEQFLMLARERRTAIMCAEAAPAHCHRSLIADALVVRGLPVVEILRATDHRPHALTPFAVVAGTAITYPSSQRTLFD